MFLSYLICLFKELTGLLLLSQLPYAMLVAGLFTNACYRIQISHFISRDGFVASEPLKGGVEYFFFKSTPSSSFPISIILFKKSTSSCLRPKAASSSSMRFSSSLVLYPSLSISTTIRFEDCKCREYLFSHLYTDLGSTSYSRLA